MVKPMPVHLIIERDHDGPKLLETVETREEAEEARAELHQENPDWARHTRIVIANAVNAGTRYGG